VRRAILLLSVMLFAIHAPARCADNIPAAASEQPKFAQRPPQFIIISVDDCHTWKGLDGLIEIMDAVKEKGGKPIVYVLYVTPGPEFGLLKENRDKAVQRLQRMFDRGSELGDHSLNHTAGGGDIGFFRDPGERFMEKAQCNIWLRENIKGLDKVYGYRTDRESLDTLNGEYLAVMPDVKTNIVQSWRWPYRLKGMESIWAMYHNGIDVTAPPFHPDITKGFSSDWGTLYSHGFGKLSVTAAVEMLKANFDAHYTSAERTPFTFSTHDFNFQEYDPDDVWAGCEHAKEIWKNFLIDIFVTEKDKYPETYCITSHQLFVYMNTQDLQKTLAEGNGQKCKSGEVLKTPEEPSREIYKKFRSTFNKQWNMMGPFEKLPNDVIAETAIDPAQWTRVTLPEDEAILCLEKIYKPTTNASAYNLVYVKSPVNRKAEVRIRGSLDRENFKLWMNDQLAASEYRWPVAVDLKEGWNKLLFRTGCLHLGTINSRYEWHFCCRITDTNGVPLYDLAYSPEPRENH